MSRIIIKNLPTNVSADKLKEKFSEFGRITDVQLKYTTNGKFRNFAFIGYETGDEANNAIAALDKSFIGTNRIQVETCAGLGDSNKPKAWSKYAPDSTAYKKIHGKQFDNIKNVLNEISTKKNNNLKPEIIDSLKKHLEDPNFLEYLEACGKKNLITSIIDKHIEPEQENSSVPDHNLEIKKEKEEEEEIQTKSAAFSSISDLEYLKIKTKGISSVNEVPIIKTEDNKTEPKIKLFNIKISNLPFKTKKKDIKELLHPLLPASIRFIENVRGVAYVGFKTEKELRQAMVKNKTFLNGKQLLFNEVEEKIKAKKPDKWNQQEESLKNEESIAESGRIFVRNLPYSVKEEELESLFSSFGPVTEVIVPVDKISRQVRGYAVVTFMMPEHAVASYCKLDGTIFHGRMLHLLPGKAKDENKDSEDVEGPYKLKKEKKLKASAGSSHNWNTLFLDHNAVAEVIADKFECTKERILTANDAAVKLALGETQLVNETRQFLEDNGVLLDAFNQEVKARSKTVILVKNLPAKTTAAEIRNIFAKYGELGRIVLPPSGITGIVEFLESSEARNAFKQLAYTRFKHLPLYLEWAPNNTFHESNEESEDKKKDLTIKVESGDDNVKEESKKDIKVKTDSDDGEENMVPEPNTTLFVKNLNFETTDESLKKHFSDCGKIASAQVSKKKDGHNPGKLLSMGYGFIQYYQQSSVVEALKNLQGSKLDGHALEIKRSNRTLSSEAVFTRKKTNLQSQTGSKIIVRNIPFQATIKEIGDLFRTFGELKFVRLPKKLVGTGPHRGFGFVEFLSKHDAKRAMKALCQSTHFYGRRLVLEWAKEDEGIDELRKRTAQRFHSDTTINKKSKVDIPIEGKEEEQEMLIDF